MKIYNYFLFTLIYWNLQVPVLFWEGVKFFFSIVHWKVLDIERNEWMTDFNRSVLIIFTYFLSSPFMNNPSDRESFFPTQGFLFKILLHHDYRISISSPSNMFNVQIFSKQKCIKVKPPKKSTKKFIGSYQISRKQYWDFWNEEVKRRQTDINCLQTEVRSRKRATSLENIVIWK